MATNPLTYSDQIDAEKLDRLAEVAIKVGLQLQAGQDLVLTAPVAALPLVRKIVAQAYKAGAGLVTPLLSDEEVTLDQMRLWATRGAHRLVLPGAQPRETMEEGWKQHDPGLARWLDRFLAHWLPARTPEVA